MDIRKRIRALREQKGLSADVMAHRLKISRPFYTQLEGGKRRISVEYLEGIARALNMTVAELYSESPLQSVEEPPQKARHLRPVNTAELRAKLEPLLGNRTADFMTCYQLWSHAPEKVKRELQEAEK